METRSWLACTAFMILSGCAGDPPSAPTQAATPAPTPMPTPTPRPCEVVCSYAALNQYYYVLVAYSISRNFCTVGYSPDYAGVSFAKKSALNACGVWGITDCQAMAWGLGGVTAVASNGTVAGGAWAAVSGAVAERRAIEACEAAPASWSQGVPPDRQGVRPNAGHRTTR